MSTKDINLDTLVSEVKKELEGLLKAEAQELSKAHPGEDTSAEVPADESSTSAPADASPAADGPPSEASASPPPADGPPADASPADASPPADASASGDPAADAGSDHDALVAEYSKLDAETLKAHFMAVKEALMAALGADPDGDGDAAGTPAAPPAPPADASPAAAAPPPAAPPAADATPPPDAPPALKGEMPADGNGEDPLNAVHKAEQDVEIASLKKKIAEQDTALEKLVKAMTAVVEAPARKSVTSIANLTKNESSVNVGALSRDEVRARLRRRVEDRRLSKSDKELVIQFDLNQISVEKVAHLLVEK